MKCNKCGYDDSGSGDMAHVCQRPSFRYGEHSTSFGLFNPKQEPVAWMNDEGHIVTDQKWAKDQHYTTPLYTTPPQPKEPEQGKPNEFLLRGILASELKCWHRLTADEAQNIIHFVQKMGAKLAQPEPVALQDDEISDAAFYAYCRGEYSRELFRAMWSNYRLTSIGWDRDELKSFARNIAALYTTTPQRKPLSDEEILTYRHMIDWTAEWSYINFARAIEAAHNIKE